jgi:hypothetical protein
MEKKVPPALCKRIINSAAIAMMMAREMWIQADRDIFILFTVTTSGAKTYLLSRGPRTSIVGALGQYSL